MTKPGNALRLLAARYRLHKLGKRIAPAVLGSSFPGSVAQRVLIYHEPSEICWSLIYPFFHYADAFAERYHTAIRTRPVAEFLSGIPGPEADIVLIQPWFTVPAAELEKALAAFRARQPKARLIFLDSYAHCDLRYGKVLEPHIERYLRKALFRDRSQFLRPFAGDTNLTEYYSTLYGLPAEPVDWQVPPALLDRLGLVPNFLTAPYLMQGFLGPEPTFDDRPIQLHSRIAVKGSSWYSAMRRHADQAARALDGVQLTPDGRIPRSEFLNEMRRSRLCWSPFGYGELCWRDLEAFMTGAVLVKPDMGHLDTLPELYHPGETYLPVKWDFSDLGEVVQGALADPERCAAIARNAFRAARDYLSREQFVEDTAQELRLS